jgi:hypothetical protein
MDENNYGVGSTAFTPDFENQLEIEDAEDAGFRECLYMAELREKLESGQILQPAY